VPHRAEVQQRLNAAGIPTAVHYPVPLNEQPAYRDLCSNDPTPVSAWLAQHVISLPMGPDLSEADQNTVVASLQNVLRAASVEKAAAAQ
jgi:UDP-2-acetamido-2-deoxy-ribo-hexuluronate aminotransferase